MLGVILGYVVYLIITLFSGDLRENGIQLALQYFPDQETWLQSLRDPKKVLENRETVTSDGTASTTGTKGTDDSGDEQKTDKARLHLSMSLDSTLKPNEVRRKQAQPQNRSSAINFGGIFDSDTASDATAEGKVKSVGLVPVVGNTSQTQTQDDVENALHRSKHEVADSSAEKSEEQL